MFVSRIDLNYNWCSLIPILILEALVHTRNISISRCDNAKYWLVAMIALILSIVILIFVQFSVDLGYLSNSCCDIVVKIFRGSVLILRSRINFGMHWQDLKNSQYPMIMWLLVNQNWVYFWFQQSNLIFVSPISYKLWTSPPEYVFPVLSVKNTPSLSMYNSINVSSMVSCAFNTNWNIVYKDYLVIVQCMFFKHHSYYEYKLGSCCKDTLDNDKPFP
jgi:hypothetical protein